MGVAELVEDWGICIWLVLRRTVLLEWEAGEVCYPKMYTLNCFLFVAC